MNRIIRTLSLAAIAALLVVGAGRAIAADVTITLTAQQLLSIQAQLPSIPGGTPGPTPPGVTCPDGSIHPAGYVCPVVPPAVGACAGFAKTLWMKASWAAPTRMLTASYGGFGVNDIVVYEFTTGNGPSQSNNLPRIAGAEYGAGAANRQAALSDKPCDFVGLGDFYSSQVSSAPTVPFTVANPYMFPGYYSNLAVNTTYYLNVKNVAGSGCTTTCDMFFDLSKNGTP